MKIALICGGPSQERGISLNSARSVMDHLEDENVKIIPYYYNLKKKPYLISKAQLYSNTPSDFDFKLQRTAKPLSVSDFINQLKKTDLVFPVVHGNFGEGGELQELLEKNKIFFIGSGSNACRKSFNKFKANQFIKRKGFFTYPSVLLKESDSFSLLKEKVYKFFKNQGLKKIVVKPANGGSSIGVFVVFGASEALSKVSFIFSSKLDKEVVLEPFIEGKEFTCIILENKKGEPVALPSTEIETSYEDLGIFDYRKKYLPTQRVKHHCPPRFNKKIIEKIQVQAEQLFSLFKMNDFARFDGWLDNSNNIWFSDFNPVSGMEQNSFLFQQTSRIGLSHRDLFRYILKSALSRYGIFKKTNSFAIKKDFFRKPVNVIFGGSTSERQVSLMSGTNAWLKLRRSSKYDPKPFLLDLNYNVWQLPYALTLNHTVEEILENCRKFKKVEERLSVIKKRIVKKLDVKEEATEFFKKPKKMSLSAFVKNSEFVFIGLHGGIGENGEFQKELDRVKVKYNGSDEKTSKLCMDKWRTAKAVEKIGDPKISPVPKKMIKTDFLLNQDKEKIKSLWKNITKKFESNCLVVKPRDDGCSSGIVCLNSANDLIKYLNFLKDGLAFIPANSFLGQYDIVEMPLERPKEFLLEKFIETDNVWVEGSNLKYKKNSGWIEVTAGVLEENKKLSVFNPSLTLSQGKILTVEEKFQGGTGINITPPPFNILSKSALLKSKKFLKKAAEILKIKGYARLDAFVNTSNGSIMLIEVNSLPALTPSTVLYQQALAQNPPVYPVKLLEKIIKNKEY